MKKKINLWSPILFTWLAILMAHEAVYSAVPEVYAVPGIYDRLGATARSSGYHDLASAAIQIKAYRIGLSKCDSRDDYKSTIAFARSLDQFAQILDGYMSSSSSRRPWRQEVETYIVHATVLARKYLVEKAVRFNGGADKMRESDVLMIRLSHQIHGQAASLLRVGKTNPAGVAQYWSSVDLKSQLSHPRFGTAVKALLDLKDEKDQACEVKFSI
jgi:hypothetical protein